MNNPHSFAFAADSNSRLKVDRVRSVGLPILYKKGLIGFWGFHKIAYYEFLIESFIVYVFIRKAKKATCKFVTTDIEILY